MEAASRMSTAGEWRSELVMLGEFAACFCEAGLGEVWKSRDRAKSSGTNTAFVQLPRWSLTLLGGHHTLQVSALSRKSFQTHASHGSDIGGQLFWETLREAE